MTEETPEYVMPEEEKHLICIWADGTWCEQEDLWEYLTMMSDDYELVEYDERIH